MAEEDWRVEVALADHAAAMKLHIAAGDDDADELYSHARRELRGRVALTHDGDRVFAYATTREAAEAAAEALRRLAEREQLNGTFTITRWHPLAERWEDPAVPLPADPAAIAAEDAEGAQENRDEQAAEGHDANVPNFEVRITLPTHGEAVALAKKLADEDLPTQRHWHYLLIGAWTEEDANQLADRLRGELALGTDIRVEATFAYVLGNTEQGRQLDSELSRMARFSGFVLF
jgi:hypothetical protein